MKALAIAFVLSTQVSLPPYQIAGAYWTPPASKAEHVIVGAVEQPERRMFVIREDR